MSIHLDIQTQFDDRAVRSSANDLQRFLHRSGTSSGDGWAEGFTRSTPKVERAMDRVATMTSKARIAQEKYNDVVKRGADDQVKLVTAAERLSVAQRNQASALRAATDEIRNAAESSQSARSSLVQLGTTVSALGRVGGPLVLAFGSAGLAGAVVQLGAVAASASQSLALLPGAAGAVGTAFGTLKVATIGLDDAFKNMSDPEKFADALRSLAPAAQQAMLSIQNMMPSLRGLQQATQDALFQGVGQQLNQLANQYLPTIQAATTGVASAFNQMFSGVTDQLMTPETQASVQSFLNNVTAAFQQLAPAAAPLTKAFSDLMAVGSSFLPDIARAASVVAQDFSAFISEARASGDLQSALQGGLDTLRQLGGLAMNVGQAFLEWAPVGQQVLPGIVDAVNAMLDILPAIGTWALFIGPHFDIWAKGINAAVSAFEGMKGVVQSVANTVIPVINTIGSAIDHALDPIRAAIGVANAANPFGDPIPQIPGYSPISQLGPAQPTQGGLPGAQRQRRGVSGSLPVQGLDPFSGLPLTPGQGLKAGDFLDFGSRKGTPEPLQQAPAGNLQAPVLPIDYTDTSGLPSNVANAVTRLDEVKHDLAEKQARLQQLESSNVATAEDIQDARNDVAKAEQDQLQAQRALQDAQMSAYEKQNTQLGQMASSLGDFGAQLDSDFGISGGLAGIADNLVRFVASLAAAPLVGKLSAISQAAGDEGSGLMGIMAANGAFGSRFMPTASNMGPAELQPGASSFGNPNAAAMMTLAQQASGGKYGWGASDLVNGLADCSGAVSDLVEILTTGKTTSGRMFTTHNAGEVLRSLGAVPGFSPGNLNVGVSHSGVGHMAATLPNGVAFESGGSHGGIAYGGPAAGALDPQFTEHWTLPVGPAAYSTGYPMAPVPSTGWAGPGVPAGITGGVGQSPVFGASPAGPGIGASVGANGLNSQAYPAGPAGGGVGMGGMALDAAMAGTSAIDMMAPGAGAAAKIGIQLANRTAKYLGQVAGIGVSGLLETFTPAGSNPKASIGNSWFGKIMGGLAGASPALPNMAGGKAPEMPGGDARNGAQAAGNQISQSVTINNNHATEDMAGNQAARELGAMYAPPGRQ